MLLSWERKDCPALCGHSGRLKLWVLSIVPSMANTSINKPLRSIWNADNSSLVLWSRLPFIIHFVARCWQIKDMDTLLIWTSVVGSQGLGSRWNRWKARWEGRYKILWNKAVFCTLLIRLLHSWNVLRLSRIPFLEAASRVIFWIVTLFPVAPYLLSAKL